jgi:putative membrane protein
VLVALRRLALFAVAAIFVLIAAVFAYGNQEPMPLDIGFMKLESVSVAVVLAITFALGAIFGGLLSALALLRHYRERRGLRRDLRRAEAELETLRRLPAPDAD